MALRAVAMRLGARRAGFVSRAYSDGKVLKEEERAAENRFIKKMEKEKLEKAKQGMKADQQTDQAGGSSSGSASSEIPGPTTESSKNLAFFAGVAGLLAVIVWFSRSSSKKQEEKNQG